MRPPLPLNTHGNITTKKLPTGKWVARTYYRDNTGKRRDITARANTKAAATHHLKTKLAEYQPVEQATATMRLADFTNQWLNEYKQTVTANTYRISENIVRNWINPAGNIRLNEITVPWLEQRIKKAGQENNGKGGRSTAIRLRTMYRMILAEAVRLGALTDNPAEHTRPVPKKHYDPTALTIEQVRTLRANVRTYYEQNPLRFKAATWMPDLVDFLAGTGCRPGEALALKWENINLENRECTIKATTVVISGASRYQPFTKTKQVRVITLPGWLVEILQGRERKSEWVFPSYSGGIVKYRNMLENFAASRGEEFSGLTPKIFRSTVATLVERELGLEAAALQLGHEGTSVTRGSYVERRGVSDVSGVLDSL